MAATATLLWRASCFPSWMTPPGTGIQPGQRLANARHLVGTGSMTMALSPRHPADRPGPDRRSGSDNDRAYLLRDPGRWGQFRPYRRAGAEMLAMAAPDDSQLFRLASRMVAADSRYGARYPSNGRHLISRQGSHPVSCRTGDLCTGTRVAWSDGQPTSGSAELSALLARILMRKQNWRSRSSRSLKLD